MPPLGLTPRDARPRPVVGSPGTAEDGVRPATLAGLDGGAESGFGARSPGGRPTAAAAASASGEAAVLDPPGLTRERSAASAASGQEGGFRLGSVALVPPAAAPWAQMLSAAHRTRHMHCHWVPLRQ